MKISMKQTTYKDRKETDKEVREISLNEYNLLTNKNTLKFFRRLGGNETIKQAYTVNGYCITRLTSSSPDRGIKIVREFTFKN